MVQKSKDGKSHRRNKYAFDIASIAPVAQPIIPDENERSGDNMYMFDKGRASYIHDSSWLDMYSKNAQRQALAFRFITVDDLVVTNTKDYAAAAKVVFSEQVARLGAEVNYASKDLTQIPAELLTSPLVESLHLGFNQLTNIHKKFFRMPVLSVLNLDQNFLDDIPKDFEHLSALTSLSLKNNRIENIHPNFCNLINLTELSMSSNLLKVLPYGWGKLSNLKRLWMSGNQIETLPSDCMVLLPDFDPTTGLRCQIFSKGIGGLVNLEELWMDNNRMTSVPKDIGTCRSLKYVNFRRNMIEILPDELGSISSLECLLLTHNKLRSIPDCMFRLPNLNTIKLDCNHMEALSESIILTTSLTDLDLSHNPLNGLPTEICLCTSLVRLQTVNCGRGSTGARPVGYWSKTHHFQDRTPLLKSDGVTIEHKTNRPQTSWDRLYGDGPGQPQQQQQGQQPRPATRLRPLSRGSSLGLAKYQGGEFDGHPSKTIAMMSAGGMLPSKRSSVYTPPPVSIRPPSTPFSSSRPGTSHRFSGAYHEAANI